MYEALDIETIWDDNLAKPLCVAITNNNKVDFKIIPISRLDTTDIIDFVLKKCSSKKIYYVHNLTFEILVFLHYLILKGEREDVRFRLISHNRVFYSAEIFHNKKKIRLRCSYRLTMLSLSNLAKLSGEEEKGVFPYKILDKGLKKIVEIREDMFNTVGEYKKFKDIYGTTIDTYKILEEYCKNDALITKKSIISYWKIIEESGLHNNNKILTAAKLSIENYFKDNNIVRKKINIRIDRTLRPYYFGGRTEVFGNMYEDEVCLHYDWSGMYAQCMKERVLGGEIYTSEIVYNLETPGFYWIRFKQDLEHPILPIRKGKLIFANGEYEGWYWFEEIKLALEYGIKLIRVDKMIGAQYYDNFIKNFIEVNDKIRERGGLYKQIGKNNNNSFYGRLGMDPERMEEEVCDKKIEGIYENYRCVNGIYINYKKSEKSVSNITISAAITSKARIRLYRGIMSVIANGGRVLYTDTDSIIAAFKKNNYETKLNKNMGEVFFDSNKEDTVIIDAVFAMPKTYALRFKNGNEVVKIKGFNETPSFNEFKKKFYLKGSVVTLNNVWCKKDYIIKKDKVEKKTNLFSLDKRKWSTDLKETYPLRNVL